MTRDMHDDWRADIASRPTGPAAHGALQITPTVAVVDEPEPGPPRPRLSPRQDGETPTDPVPF